MFIDAAQLSQIKAPSDAGSMAIETAIRQQKEFEEALKLAQDRREAEAEAAAKRAKAEARDKDDRSDRSPSSEAVLDMSELGAAGSDDSGRIEGRGVSVDVEV